MQISHTRLGPVALDPSPAQPSRGQTATPLLKKPRAPRSTHTPTTISRRRAGAPILPVRRARDCRERGLPMEATTQDEIVKIAERLVCSHG